MRFLMTVHADENTKKGLAPDPKLLTAIGKLAEEQARAGKLVTMGGLGWQMPSTRVTVKAGELTFTDGPFPETKELIAGFAIFDVESQDAAKAAAKQFLDVHREILGPGYSGTVDIHQIF